MIPSLEGWPTKAEETPSPHEVRLAPLDTNPVFQNLAEILMDLDNSFWMQKILKFCYLTTVTFGSPHHTISGKEN